LRFALSGWCRRSRPPSRHAALGSVLVRLAIQGELDAAGLKYEIEIEAA
jgi:hypothetical protein